MEFCAHSHSYRPSHTGAKNAPKPFALAGHHSRYLPDCLVINEHIRLQLVPNFEDHSISGSATLTVRTKSATEVTRLEIDQRELIIHQVNVSHGREKIDSRIQTTDDKLILLFDQEAGLQPGEQYDILISYETAPRWGLHFVGPDEAFPEKPVQLWTLSQEENSRYWFPCFDHPDIRATLDMLVTVPKTMQAISNGELVSADSEGDLQVYHWHMDSGLPPYLMNLVVGDFAVIETEWKGVPVRYVVPHGREGDAELSLGRTPEMIEFLSTWTAMAYPYKRYDQIVVHDYLFGGMEHTTATTLTERTLRNERASLDSSSDSLVSHELAHQWFGNTVTCREWPQAWLNEGFATYCEYLWTEHDHGTDEARYNMLSSVLPGYLSESSNNYMRAIVDRRVHQPIDLFDGHLYNKGAVVLNYLRYTLGDAGFQKSIQRYLRENAQSSVDSHDLMRAVTEETGKRCERFFEQWVFGAGHVKLKLKTKWDESQHLLSLHADQEQNWEGVPDCFYLEFDVDICVDQEWQSHRLTMTERNQTFAFHLAAKPSIVSPDPRAVIPGPIKWNAPETLLCQQLVSDREATGRVRAARALGSKPSLRSIKALYKALDNDPFWGVAKEAARALAKIKTPKAQAALLKALPQARHPKTRRAVIKALGEFKDPQVVQALKSTLSADESIFVEAEAARSLGRTKSASAFEELCAVLTERDSWHDVVRAGCLTGLASLDDPDRCLDLVLEWSQYAKALDCRTAATKALRRLADCSVASQSLRARERLQELVTDPNFRIQLAAIRELGSLGDRRSMGVLEECESRDVDGRVRRSCREAINSISEDSTLRKRVQTLEGQLKSQESEGKALKERVVMLEAALKKNSE
jgi:aminopeptidase N